MQESTKKKLKRRLEHLQDVLCDCLQEPDDDGALIAMFHSARDIQPGLCEAIAEQTGMPSWRRAYADQIWSDEEQISNDTFLWPEELEEAEGE